MIAEEDRHEDRGEERLIDDRVHLVGLVGPANRDTSTPIPVRAS
jgi:hypothetical protein